MEVAGGLALTSTMCQKVGAVIKYKGKIVTQSVNQTVGTKPHNSKFNSVSRHAEQGAIEALLRNLRLLGQARLLLCEKGCYPQRTPSSQAAQDWREAEEKICKRGAQKQDRRGHLGGHVRRSCARVA